MVIGIEPSFASFISSEDVRINQRDYCNDALVEIEYNIVKSMYYISGFLIAERIRTREKNVYIDSPYKKYLKSAYVKDELEKYFKFRTAFLDKMVYRNDSPDYIDYICNTVWKESDSYIVAANNAFLISLCSVWDYTTDSNYDRYIVKAPIYKCLAITWSHKAINALKSMIDFQECFNMTTNEENLPDLLKQDKLVRSVYWSIFYPLVKIGPKRKDFELKF